MLERQKASIARATNTESVSAASEQIEQNRANYNWLIDTQLPCMFVLTFMPTLSFMSMFMLLLELGGKGLSSMELAILQVSSRSAISSSHKYIGWL